jgi:hypothetical protein
LPNGNAADRRKQKRKQQRLNFPDGEPSSEIDDGSDEGTHLNQQEKGRKQMTQNPPEKPDHWYSSAGFWTAVFTGVLCLFTALLWKVSNEANTFNASNQRAMINFGGPYLSKKMAADGKKVDGWQVYYAWSNSGRNPAKGVEAQFNYSLSDRRPTKDLNFGELPTRDTLPLILGPGTMFQMPPVDLSLDDLSSIESRKQHLFFWGWITYDDGNPHSSRRLTEFCTDVTGLTWTGPSDHTDPLANFSIQTPPCETHNCYDETCADYDQRTK